MPALRINQCCALNHSAQCSYFVSGTIMLIVCDCTSGTRFSSWLTAEHDRTPAHTTAPTTRRKKTPIVEGAATMLYRYPQAWRSRSASDTPVNPSLFLYPVRSRDMVSFPTDPDPQYISDGFRRTKTGGKGWTDEPENPAHEAVAHVRHEQTNDGEIKPMCVYPPIRRSECATSSCAPVSR